jgi:hypothetical protein
MSSAALASETYPQSTASQPAAASQPITFYDWCDKVELAYGTYDMNRVEGIDPNDNEMVALVAELFHAVHMAQTLLDPNDYEHNNRFREIMFICIRFNGHRWSA